MNINKFKVGDIITRVKPCKYDHNDIKDGSYLGERLTLLGHDRKSKIIFFNVDKNPFKEDILDLSYGRDGWDKGWQYYPETMWQKLKAELQRNLKLIK